MIDFRVTGALFIAWVVLLAIAVETKLAVARALLPVVLLVLLLYLTVSTVVYVWRRLGANKKEEVTHE